MNIESDPIEEVLAEPYPEKLCYTFALFENG